MRLEALKRASAAGPGNGGSVAREVREEALARRSSILLGLGRSEEVADLLANEPLLPDQPLFALLLEARIRAGRFDRAATQQPDPSKWIAVLSRLAADPATSAAATAIAEEIARRFGEQLTPEQINGIAPYRTAIAPAPTPPPTEPDAAETPVAE